MEWSICCASYSRTSLPSATWQVVCYHPWCCTRSYMAVRLWFMLVLFGESFFGGLRGSTRFRSLNGSLRPGLVGCGSCCSGSSWCQYRPVSSLRALRRCLGWWCDWLVGTVSGRPLNSAPRGHSSSFRQHQFVNPGYRSAKTIASSLD